MSLCLDFICPGVVSGKDLHKIFFVAKKNKFALAAINCIDTNSINSVLEAAKKYRTIAIIQFSFTGSIFFVGKKLSFYKDKIDAAVYGSILAAKYVHEVSRYYNIPVILHTDHCTKEYLPWLNILLKENKNYYNLYGKTLFTSHMIDLSNYSIDENINICSYYLKKMSSMDINLEIELGCTGGEEDGLDNSNISHEKLYTNPEDVLYAYDKLIKISKYFTIAASFGNTHGVYKSGNVKLSPNILYDSQKLVSYSNNLLNKNPLNFVFHGGSGTSDEMISESIKYGVVKINLDTDIQWSFWNGILQYYFLNKKYLVSQLGNPLGEDKPNKKFYDPRIWLRYGQKSIINYLKNIFYLFKCNNLV